MWAWTPVPSRSAASEKRTRRMLSAISCDGELSETVTDIIAQADEDVTYYVNESPLAVENQGEVKLLADELAATPDALG